MEKRIEPAISLVQKLYEEDAQPLRREAYQPGYVHRVVSRPVGESDDDCFIRVLQMLSVWLRAGMGLKPRKQGNQTRIRIFVRHAVPLMNLEATRLLRDRTVNCGEDETDDERLVRVLRMVRFWSEVGLTLNVVCPDRRATHKVFTRHVLPLIQLDNTQPRRNGGFEEMER